MKEVGEILARIGLGGFYRRTVNAEGEEIRGPYPTRRSANPYGNARLPFPLSVSAEFHFRKPGKTVAPDPAELEKIK